MEHAEQRFGQQKPAEDHLHSVLDGKQYIAGFRTSKLSSIEAAKRRGDAKACTSVLDGPACIGGVNSKH